MIAIPPVSSYIDIQSNQPLSMDPAIKQRHEKQIAEYVNRWAASNHIAMCHTVLKIDYANEPELLQSIAENARAVAEGFLPPRFIPTITSLSRSEPERPVTLLFIHYQIKLGTGSIWIPNTGQITSAAGSATLYAALLDASTRKHTWQNASIQRQIVEMDQPQLQSIFNALFHFQSTQNGGNQ